MSADRYGITLVLGERERGKTTFGVRDMVRKIDAGVYRKGYANIHVKHPKVKFITYENFHKLHEPTVDGLPTAILYLDQLHKYLDARESLSKRNVYMSQVAIESRQHGLDWIGTTWSIRSIDLRVANWRQRIVYGERDSRNKRFLYTVVEPESKSVYTKALSWKDCKEKWWNYFDSTELVEDVPANWDPRQGPNPLLKAKMRAAAKAKA